ncbi:uncharacterized protein LOC100829484 [Brachypodium distachyon]|uniref:Uncharacterized protein n=1 Tax=Brachypodium distachyon TaxID=15368 RepID=I1HQB1_BRADI|nr:uncharacterized protein LOC100829484 [Brachypodium distachyon]KQK09156.1 hypothetical protein BRADI_2g46345v3 [Brachypodium distachyon]|eukprot:XP_003566987.1 uncharacterized protein LOC100829484 [Brachypodium distachyon]
MLGRKRGGSSSSSSRPHAEDAAPAGGTKTVVADGGRQEVTVSQFVAQLDEAARERLDRMNRRLRLLEQQMETLEAEVGRASTTDN